jgi:nucleoside-diphosphate-sugar epimerase
VLGSPDARISLIHAQDLADAVGVLLADDRGAGLVAEIDDGHGGYRWHEMVATAAGAFGRPARILPIPKAIPYALGCVNLLLARLPAYTPMLTPGKVREIYHRDWACDNGPITRQTSWRPRVLLDQGFAGTIAW